EYSHHPSERVLQAYLEGRLGDEWHFDEAFLPTFRRADLNGDWGLSEVSLHLLTCNLCCERVARLRAEELAALERERSLGARLLSRVKGWLGLEWIAEWNRRLAERLGGLVAIGISPFVLDLSLGTSVVSPISLGLLYQHARGGLEFQGGALIEDRGYEC
ncbi:MAG: hypothetical protein ACE5KR_04670, partial [Candidatus Bipolaricaulia bacterium]